MFQSAWAVEIRGMRNSKPFSWLLAVGMLCSLAGLAFAELPMATGAAEQVPTPQTSAAGAAFSPPSNAVQTVVTEASPVATPIGPTSVAPPEISAAVAPVIATPTQAPLPQPITAAPASAIQSLPSSVEEPVELPRASEKAHQLFDLMNAARRDAGVEPLEWDASLEEVAYARAANLVDNGYFDHYAPDGESAFSELAARGIQYRLAGENLARNNYLEAKTVAAAFDGLMNSPGHRANILEPRFSSVGVAAVKDGKMWVYVMVFLN